MITNDKITNSRKRTENIYLRIPEYIAYSFKPPGFSYAPKIDGTIGNGGVRVIEDAGSLGRSSAVLTFVSTLRDDLHFSLNFLWQLGFGS